MVKIVQSWYKKNQRLALLMVAWMVLMCIAVPLLQATLGISLVASVERFAWRGYAYLRYVQFDRYDPVIGTRVTPISAQVVKGEVDSKRYKAVIFVGRLSPCTLRGLEGIRIYSNALKDSLQILIMYSGDRTTIKAIHPSPLGKAFVWVYDDEQKYALRWNAYFKPRVYLVDKHWRLQYIQPYQQSVHQAMVEVVNLLEAKYDKN